MEENQTRPSSKGLNHPHTLSSDGETETCMPMIVNTVSLHGCAFTFDEDQMGVPDSPLYPECELEEESNENGINHNNRARPDPEKKRIKLTTLNNVERPKARKPRPSSFRSDQTNIVDAGKLALQENMFKTKELFDTFLRVCQDKETSDEMEKVVQKMIRSYDKTKIEFLGSLRLQKILEEETEKVNTSNTKPWLNLKFVLDEMKNNKKQAAPKLKLGDSEESQDPGGYDDEPVIECPKKRRHLKKLEKFMRAINLKIKHLEEKEVNLEDDDDSSYLKLDRYRTQIVKVYKKVCEIKGQLSDADRPYLRKVSFAGTTYPHINRCIEKYYNKHREFPDFQDIKKLVFKANEQENIQMPPMKIHTMAQNAFKEFGEMLKRLRQYDDYDVMISYLDQQVDPARDDEALQEQLTKNALLFKKREQEVIDKFAEKDAGLDSGSDDSSSDSKPVKKKRKIIIATPRKTHSKSRRQLSDEEEHETESKTVKKPVLSDSSNSGDSSDSGSNEKKRKKKVVNGKGKTLIGKSRIIKKGKSSVSPKKDEKPPNVFSSDEEPVPEDTKDAFADYLGLKGKYSEDKPKTISKVKEESEDEITCLKEIKTSPTLGKNEDKTNMQIMSKESLGSKAPNNTCTNAKSRSKITNLSDDESIEAGKKAKPKRKRSSRDSSEESEKSSVVESGDDDEKSKRISDVDLSPDSSDDEGSKKKAESSVIVLSEDVPLTSQASAKQVDLSHDSDSDDIFILSQESKEMKKVVPRRKSTEDKVHKNLSLNKSTNSLSKKLNPLKRRPSVITSTPKKMAVSKKRTHASITKRPDPSGSEQRLGPQVVNKAPRKITNKRICPLPPNESKFIPVIELD